ncbi:PAP2 superfamily protein [Silicimonas algicola]|uniref:PAP2 superfamily protein n=2 Tax=Silicimonas algicola TaxID=1826607 RepID=A0A316GAF4_9RHOB|nr:PAP2 superfamily protein [Silicimonas algicola]
MLSWSLVTTHDGIVGYWDGEPLRVPPRMGTSDEDLSYLSKPVRSLLIDAMLHPAFRVTGSDGQATASVEGRPLFTIERPSRAVFRQQLKMVRAYADLRADRVNEILMQTGDLFSFFGAQCYLSAERNAKTLAMLYTCQRLMVTLEMPLKHFCRAPRPVDYATHIQPMIQTPDHSSYPSGHAIEVFAAATVLARLTTGLGPKAAMTETTARGRRAGMAFRLAHRIATNRSIAGVHFPVDSGAGAVAGCLLGEAVYRVATGLDDWPDEVSIGFETQGDGEPPYDLTLNWLRNRLPDDADAGAGDPETILGTLWAEAALEWRELTE